MPPDLVEDGAEKFASDLDSFPRIRRVGEAAGR
jgi:hypothetical protein